MTSIWTDLQRQVEVLVAIIGGALVFVAEDMFRYGTEGEKKDVRGVRRIICVW